MTNFDESGTNLKAFQAAKAILICLACAIGIAITLLIYRVWEEF